MRTIQDDGPSLVRYGLQDLSVQILGLPVPSSRFPRTPSFSRRNSVGCPKVTSLSDSCTEPVTVHPLNTHFLSAPQWILKPSAYRCFIYTKSHLYSVRGTSVQVSAANHRTSYIDYPSCSTVPILSITTSVYRTLTDLGTRKVLPPMYRHTLCIRRIS